MKSCSISFKQICYLIACVIVIIFIFSLIIHSEGLSRHVAQKITDVKEEDKDDIVTYIGDVSLIIRDVDITIRNIGLKYLSVKDGGERMDTYIAQIESMRYPQHLLRQHKMVLLSFRKLRIGLLLFSVVERKDVAIGLIKDGSRLLKYATKDIVDIAKKEGIVKEKEQKGE